MKKVIFREAIEQLRIKIKEKKKFIFKIKAFKRFNDFSGNKIREIVEVLSWL